MPFYQGVPIGKDARGDPRNTLRRACERNRLTYDQPGCPGRVNHGHKRLMGSGNSVGSIATFLPSMLVDIDGSLFGTLGSL